MTRCPRTLGDHICLLGSECLAQSSYMSALSRLGSERSLPIAPIRQTHTQAVTMPDTFRYVAIGIG
jgi:hypothetical protein